MKFTLPIRGSTERCVADKNMKPQFQKATRVTAIAGRSLAIRVLLFFLSAYIFLWVPDLDHLLIGLLHHRSIVTHSLFPGILIILFGRELGASVISGAFVGLSVHLSADLLSPMIGFARIWLPYPWKISLGTFSYLWLFTNAFAGFALAPLIARKAFPPQWAWSLVTSTSIATAFLYGSLNEQSAVAVAVTFVLLALSLAPEYLLRNRLGRRKQM